MGQGLVCGAVSGSLLILGLGPGRNDDESRARAETVEMAREFSHRFVNDHGSIICKELLGVDVGTEDGHRQAVARGLFESACPRFVAKAAALLEMMLAGSAVDQSSAPEPRADVVA